MFGLGDFLLFEKEMEFNLVRFDTSKLYKCDLLSIPTKNVSFVRYSLALLPMSIPWSLATTVLRCNDWSILLTAGQICFVFCWH